jgi:hypothetical protein
VVKLPLNQLLAPDAVTRAIKVEHFHLRLAPIDKDKQLATERIIERQLSCPVGDNYVGRLI